MVGTLCLSGAVLQKAGELVDATIKNETDLVTFINQAEGYLCAISRYDWVANFSSLNATKRKILEEAASNLAAIYAIQYNMGGYNSRIEAEDLINILWARFQECVEVLKDQNAVKFINGS